MAEIAILGYGTVGSGVVEVLKTNQNSIDKKAAQPIRIKKILDLREFKDKNIARLITHNFDDILNDNDILIIVEAMGGVEPAYTYVKKALLRGKSVVTSNKELVAKHGAELLQIARENNLNFLFEASVGGGIPIIRPLNLSLTADEIYQISGILNGTTNYILTEMTRQGKSFEQALLEAQELGYAEKNPEADVEGYDAVRKIAILLSLAIGKQVDYEKIYTEGITKITKADIDFAKAINGVIKLIATAKIGENSVFARVSPAIIFNKNPMSVVNDVFNAIVVKGNVIGEVMFYGRGAGKLPTASAIVADIVDALKHLNRNIMHFWSSEKHEILSISEATCTKFIRVEYINKEKAMNDVKNIFGGVSFVFLDKYSSEFAFQTGICSENEIDNKIEELLSLKNIKEVKSSLRIEE